MDPMEQAAVLKVLMYLHSSDSHVALNEDQGGPSIVLYSGYRKAGYVDVTAGTTQDGVVKIPAIRGKFTRLRNPVDYWVVDGDTVIIVPECHIARETLVGDYYIIPLENTTTFQMSEMTSKESDAKN